MITTKINHEEIIVEFCFGVQHPSCITTIFELRKMLDEAETIAKEKNIKNIHFSSGRLTIYGIRKETDREFEIRKLEEEQYKENCRKSQYKQYLELKEKFEVKT